MKKLYIFGLLLLIVAVKTSAQNGPVFNLNKLSNQDTLLSGWKFHPGDNPQWAKPDFDDSHWQLADPGTDITKFDKPFTAHTLLHSFATHLLNMGTNLHVIKTLLGHSKLETTMVYLHLQKHTQLGIVSPLEAVVHGGAVAK